MDWIRQAKVWTYPWNKHKKIHSMVGYFFSKNEEYSISWQNGPELQIRFLNLKGNLSLNYLSWAGPSNLGSKWLKNDLKMCSMASLDANDVMDSAFCRQNFTLYSKTKLVQSKNLVSDCRNSKFWQLWKTIGNFLFYQL